MTGYGSTPARPPRIARWLIARATPPEYEDAVLGDLDETFDEMTRGPGSRARGAFWYWRQLLTTDLWRLRVEARAERRRSGQGEAGMMDTMGVEFRQAVRVFRRSPGFVAVVLGTLAIGIGGTTSIFSLVNGLLLRPIPGVVDSMDLAVVRASENGGAYGVASYMDYLDVRERSRAFERMAAFKPRQVDAAAAGAPEPVGALMVTSDYFEVLGLSPQVGRFFSVDVDEGPGAHFEVVLTDGLWRRWFASDPNTVGQGVVLNGLTYTVIGVTPAGFRGTTLMDVPELFVPMTMQAELMPGSGFLLDRRGWGGIEIVGRLTEGTPLSTAANEVASLGQQLAAEYPQTNERRAYTATGFREAAMPGEARGPIVQMSMLLLGVVTALWMVVCLNVANLFLARSMRRRQELAVRIAMGAGRGRVLRQLVLEFMTIAVVSAVAGMALARLIAGAVATLPLPVVFDIGIDGPTILFVGALALASGLLCALVPALTLSVTDPRSAAVPGGAFGARRHRWPSRILVVGQVTVSVALLFATALFARTFTNLTSADAGFDSSAVLTARFNPRLQGFDGAQVADFYDRLTASAAAIPGVTQVMLADGLPGSGFGSDTWFFENATDPEQSSSLSFSAVSTNYFDGMGIPVVEGRGFTEQDAPGRPPAIVVNEAAARLIEARTGTAAVGQGIGMNGPGGPFLPVVGVVGDSRAGRTSQAQPFVYGPHRQVLELGFGGDRMVVMLRTTVAPGSLTGDLRRTAATVDPNVSAADVMTMEQFLADLLAADRLTVTVLGASSLIALLLVAIGLYGLLSYVVTQRTREFGIRLALGARTRSLKSIVLREAMGLSGVGIVLGVAGALAVSRLTAQFLVEVSPTDPASMVASLLAVAGVTLAAAYVPAARAMRADPVEAMRNE